jgi:hypothetical protein
MVAATALAGCTDDAGIRDGKAVDADDFALQSGRGAIAGLLVDDRFRPIQLTPDAAATEFQAEGFILLQETGQQTRTTQNGEFSFVDLPPGAYTIRVSASGHEATPQRVTVTAGEFAETSVVARRVAGDAVTIITQEYAVFIPCSIFFIANGLVYDCTLDQSGDSFRAFYFANHSALPEVTAMVTEMKANRVGNYAVQVRSFPSSGTEYYAVAVPEGVDHIRIVNEIGVPNEEWTDFGPNTPWNNTHEFQTIMFAMGMFHRMFADSGIPGVCCGVGVILGTKAQFLQSVFLGPPEVDLAAYCVLC